MTPSTRTFCCCIPTRLGVVLVALVSVLGGGAVAISGILNLASIQGGQAPIKILIAICILLVLVSLLGLIGALGRKLILVKLYSTALALHFLFSFATGIYALCRVFKDGPSFIARCLKANQDMADADKACAEGLGIVKGVFVTFFIALWLFEIWGYVIVRGYSRQLQEEKGAEGVVKDPETW